MSKEVSIQEVKASQSTHTKKGGRGGKGGKHGK